MTYNYSNRTNHLGMTGKIELYDYSQGSDVNSRSRSNNQRIEQPMQQILGIDSLVLLSNILGGSEQ